MYCSHCGKKINEEALEKKQSSYVVKDENGELLPVDTDQKVEYVCPQCGHLVHADLNEEEIKSLSRAAHSQLQRGANSFNFGMAFILLGFGIYNTIVGINKKVTYTKLLKDLNNKTFVQQNKGIYNKLSSNKKEVI